MGRTLARATAAALTASTLASHAHGFLPGSALSSFRGSVATAPAATRLQPRPRRVRCGSSTAVMKVAATQPQQDNWQDGGLKTREIFNALSQGEIGKRAFTQALAKRILAKATGMQQDYELESEAASIAASSSAAVGEDELR